MPTRHFRLLAAVLLFALSLTAACGDDGATDGGADSGGATDGATDGSTPDAGRRDSATPTDSGAPSDGSVGTPCAIPAPFDEGLTYETTLHVTTGGNDDSGDGSMGAPFASIEGAVRAAGPSTRILVAAGTYSGAVGLSSVQGEAGRPIAIVADGDVTLDVGGADEVGFAISELEYVVVEGFTIRGAGIHGMNIDDGGSYDTPAHHLVLRDITIPGAGSGGNNDCIKMSGVDDFWVLDSDVSGCDQGEGIDMVGCHRGVISGNYFHDTVGTGVQAKGGSADTLVHGNRFERIPGRGVNAGGSTGLPYFRPMDAPHEAARIRVVANVFEEVGAMSGAPIAYTGCDTCDFVNNSIIDPQTWVVRILQESTDARFVPSRNGTFVNNIIVLDTSVIRTYFNVGGGTSPETFTFANNLWYATDQGAGWGGPTFGDGIPPETDGIVQEDPAMVDRAGGDYHLMASSPARGAGRAPGFAVPADLDGVCYAEPPTLGAYEIP